MSTPPNAKALHTGSGIPWEEWLPWLEARGARDLDHTALAALVLGHIQEVGGSGSPEWWAQGVAIAYERHLGRRLPGQTCDGDFQVTVSRTLPGDMDQCLKRWQQLMQGVQEADGVPFTGEPRVSRTEKWRYWRVGLADGSRLSVNVQTKATGEKSTLSVNHDGIGEQAEVERWRAHWKVQLKALP